MKNICGKNIPGVGLGCMGMSEFYGPSSDANSVNILNKAFEIGYRHLDTADMYGQGHNERLIGKFLNKNKSKRSEILLSTKVGIVRNETDKYSVKINGTPNYIIKSCEDSLKRLGVEAIDLYYLHRIDQNVPVEESMGAMKILMEQGKVRNIGLCEVSVEMATRANTECKISAIQSEYSLWTRNVEQSILPYCEKNNISLVGFSPLGRGFLTGEVDSKQIKSESDFRNRIPRFSEEHFEKNLLLVKKLKNIAESMNLTPSNLALGWILSKSKCTHVIPGTRTEKYLIDNFRSQDTLLSSDDISILDKLFSIDNDYGSRYPEAIQKIITSK